MLSELKLRFSSAESQLSEAIRRWKSGDKVSALRWGRHAAKRLPLAKVVVAQWLMLGKYDSRAASEAIDLLTSAAEGGLSEGQQVLAACYLHGDGVAKDASRAIYWTRRQADAGDVNGQIDMVGFLTQGEHCEVDLPGALHYATLAAENGRSELLAALLQDLQREGLNIEDARTTTRD